MVGSQGAFMEIFVFVVVGLVVVAACGSGAYLLLSDGSPGSFRIPPEIRNNFDIAKQHRKEFRQTRKCYEKTVAEAGNQPALLEDRKAGDWPQRVD
jgi:hypothetical protein